ncbi:MAG TPA: hypothetical protein VMD97_08890 [Candidatus Aquilonibacter sp.]|nr:hypothetical protein [Candidatus Aquilonibacter sp.]
MRSSLLLAAVLMMTGCQRRYTPPESPMPPNTVLLSQMMRELSARPGFTEALLRELEGASDGKRGPALLTPDLLTELRKRILGKDWQGVDRFPGWTMRAINPTVHVISHAVQPKSGYDVVRFLDLGPYTLDREQTADLDQPSNFPPFTTKGIVTQLGYGVQRGDGPNQLAPEHAESQRLADALNRLAANALDGAAPFTASIDGHAATSPQALVSALIASGYTVTVIDARYFANFGHLHYSPRGSSQPSDDVMMPFWVDTGYAVPGTGGPFDWGARPLLVPVSHAEYEWSIQSPKDDSARGSHINADVSYYFGVDGKSEWRTMDTLDQAWVLKRAAHTYTGAQAVEVTRLAGLLTVAYMHQHQRHPDLPFGGYYTLGVCQDGIAAIEHRMTGKTTLFPNTADTSLFNDPRDAEVNALLEVIPKDRGGTLPEPDRIFGSLPTLPGSDNGFDAVTIPGLARDLQLSYTAWQQGRLHHIHHRLFYAAIAAGAVAGAIALFALISRRRHSSRGSTLSTAER